MYKEWEDQSSSLQLLQGLLAVSAQPHTGANTRHMDPYSSPGRPAAITTDNIKTLPTEFSRHHNCTICRVPARYNKNTPIEFL